MVQAHFEADPFCWRLLGDYRSRICRVSNDCADRLPELDAAPSEEERQQSLDNCIDLLKGPPVGWTH
jgi:hypothetical protein